MSMFTLRVRDFRALERIDWAPSGVCVLAGANGAGKTTTLDALRFVRELFVNGQEDVFQVVDGVAFRRWGAGLEAPVEFALEVGEIRWKVRFPMSAQGIRGTYGEELHRGEEVVIRAAMFQETWDLRGEAQPRHTRRCGARVLWDRGTEPWMKPLVDFLEGIRVYPGYSLGQVKTVQPVSQGDAVLHGDGRNLWSVLSNWKASPLRYGGRYQWVMDEAHRAFPDLIGSIEFDRGIPYVFRPGSADPAEGLLPNRQADGLLAGLLHLTAVAGAPGGSLLAFDELEEHLHPHAIRSVISAMRAKADEQDLTIVLTTHSPVVLNQFRDEPDQVYVLGHGDPDAPSPAPMTDLHDEAWIAQAKLGSLYEQLAFGAPPAIGKTAP